jgi:biotin operon repressor
MRLLLWSEAIPGHVICASLDKASSMVAKSASKVENDGCVTQLQLVAEWIGQTRAADNKRLQEDLAENLDISRSANPEIRFVLAVFPG